MNKLRDSGIYEKSARDSGSSTPPPPPLVLTVLKEIPVVSEQDDPFAGSNS